jgi:hypothetical protein
MGSGFNADHSSARQWVRIVMISRAYNEPRLWRSSRGIFLVLVAILCGLPGGAFAQAPPSIVPALDGTKELASINRASILDNEPADAQAVRAVCTRCHSSAQFLGTPRSPRRWTLVFAQMTELGAAPTDDQIDGIIRYFQRNLTVVNVNTSPAEELAPTLQVSNEVAGAIILRRMQKRIADIRELATVPGVAPDKLAKLADRLQF